MCVCGHDFENHADGGEGACTMSDWSPVLGAYVACDCDEFLADGWDDD